VVAVRFYKKWITGFGREAMIEQGKKLKRKNKRNIEHSGTSGEQGPSASSSLSKGLVPLFIIHQSYAFA